MTLAPFISITHDFNFSSIFQPLHFTRFIVHSPYELPSYSGQQFFIKRNEIKAVQISPEVFLLSKDLESSPPTLRNCFLPDEKPLKYFKVYTKKNCEQECLSSMIDESCGCVPFYVISECKKRNINFIQKLFDYFHRKSKPDNLRSWQNFVLQKCRTKFQRKSEELWMFGTMWGSEILV